MHGGASLKGTESPTFKSGMYSQYVDPEQLVGFSEWRGEVGETFNFERRLMGIMFIMEQWVYHGSVETRDGEKIPLEPGAVAAMCNAITRAYQAITKRHEGETIHVKLAQPEILKAFRAVGEAVARHVSDPAEAAAVAADVQAALQQLALEEGGE